jgi:hypothetical protein
MQVGGLRVSRTPAIIEEIESLLGPESVCWIFDGHD